MNELYKQCLLKCGDVTTTAWIEEKYAKVGLSGKFKDAKNDDRSWEVIEVINGSLPKNMIDRHDRQAETFISHANPVNKMRGNK